MTIPRQLQDNGNLFCLVKPREKIPFEKNWQHGGYKHDDPKLTTWLEEAGNVGILTGQGLVVFDCDCQQAENLARLLPKTFVVGTSIIEEDGHKFRKKHFYYACPLQRKQILKDYDKHLGEIQALGQQCLIPPSVHPSGTKYEVLQGLPIASISEKDLLKAISPFVTDTSKTKRTESVGEEIDPICIEIKNKIKVPDLLKKYGFDTTKNPTKCLWHESQGGQCFSFNDDLWNCFHCGRGGSLFHLVMAHESVDFTEAKRKLVIMAEIDVNNIHKLAIPTIPAIPNKKLIKPAGSLHNGFVTEPFERAAKESDATLTEAHNKALDLEECVIELFADVHGTPYATIRNNGHNEHWPIGSTHFKEWVTKMLFEKEEKPPSDQLLNGLLRLYSARAKFQGRQNVETHLRVARNDEGFFVDLCSPDWKVLAVTPNGIKITDSPPVVFRRYGHMKPLEVDLKANISDFDKMFSYVPIPENLKLFYKVSLILDFVPDIPRAISLTYGPQGSAKSTIMRMERALCDPSTIGLLSIKRDEGEMAQQAYHHYIAFWDNVGRLNKQQSDFCCRVVTGEGTSKRALYTNEDDIIFTMIRKLGLNGISIAGTEPDFLDRAITFRLNRIPKDKRRTEAELWKSFRKDQPKITGACMKILQRSMSIVRNIKVKELPRMADFAVWGEAVSRAIGELPGAFLHTLWDNVGALNREALEASSVGLALRSLLSNNPKWEGTPTELLRALENEAELLKIDIRSKRSGWPGNPAWLRRKIEHLDANLAEEGIVFQPNHDGKERKWSFIVNSVISLDDSDSVSLGVSLGGPLSLVAHDSEKKKMVPHGVANDTNDNLTIEKNISLVAHDSEKIENNDTNDINSKSFHKKVSEDILEILKNSNNGTHEDGLFPLIQTKNPELQRVDFDDVISKLKTQGQIFEISPGMLKVVT